MKRPARPEVDDPAAMLLAEARKSNHLLAVIATKDMNQARAIGFLDSVGLQPKDIAAVLGITSNAVSIALHRMRKSAAAGSPSADIKSSSEDGGPALD